jgi:hypothetical protein
MLCEALNEDIVLTVSTIPLTNKEKPLTPKGKRFVQWVRLRSLHLQVQTKGQTQQVLLHRVGESYNLLPRHQG